MKVVDPTVSSHDITLIPRVVPAGALTLVLFNEVTKTSTTVANSYVVNAGNLTITFTFTFVNKDKYQIKISEGSVVIYRGKILATTQTPQNYKLTDGRYTY